MPARRIVIAGAGIGGLTAALALAARGFSILIAERSAALQPIGAGVQLSPNASRLLIDLGLREALEALATAPSAVVLNSVRARGEVARLLLPQQPDAPYWVIHRADLQAALARAAMAHPAIDLRLGTPIGTFEDNTTGVLVGCGDAMIEAEALIAVDGVHSHLRQKLFPASQPQVSGRVAWRGIASVATEAEVRLWMARDAHLVTYPVAGSSQTNLVLTRKDDCSDPASVSGQTVADQLQQTGWPEGACRLIAQAETLTPYPLFTVPALASWQSGRVALLGDAAHAMLPFAAQGAAMAIEDAVVLARCLTDDSDVAEALKHYSDLRRPRIAEVVRAAEQSGRIYHMGGAMALARDTAIGLLGGKRLLERQNWIYEWTP